MWGYTHSLGVAYYEAHISEKDETEIAIHERFTHTWLRGSEGWKIIGGMSAPLTHP